MNEGSVGSILPELIIISRAIRIASIKRVSPNLRRAFEIFHNFAAVLSIDSSFFGKV